MIKKTKQNKTNCTLWIMNIIRIMNAKSHKHMDTINQSINQVKLYEIFNQKNTIYGLLIIIWQTAKEKRL